MNRMNYKIALQSKKMLTDALFRLIETGDYSQITVTQICQEADLSRRTFYRLYKTKEDILHEYMDLLTEQFKNMVAKTAPMHYLEVAEAYFDFWNQHTDFLKLLRKNKLLDILYKTVRDRAPSVFHMVKPGIQANETVLAFALSYSLGGLNGMLIQWVEDDMCIPPNQMAAILKQTLKIAIS